MPCEKRYVFIKLANSCEIVKRLVYTDAGGPYVKMDGQHKTLKSLRGRYRFSDKGNA